MGVNKKEKQKNYLYYFQNITMKNTTRLNQRVEKNQKTRWTKVRAAILATLIGLGVNWMAQNIQPDEQPHTQSEVVKKDTRIAVHGMLSL